MKIYIIQFTNPDGIWSIELFSYRTSSIYLSQCCRKVGFVWDICISLLSTIFMACNDHNSCSRIFFFIFIQNNLRITLYVRRTYILHSVCVWFLCFQILCEIFFRLFIEFFGWICKQWKMLTILNLYLFMQLVHVLHFHIVLLVFICSKRWRPEN